MAKEEYGCEGNEVVKTLKVKGYEVNVYGCYDYDTTIGKYEFYDVYIVMNKIQHCMNEGDPFYKKPTKKEIVDLVNSFLK